MLNRITILIWALVFLLLVGIGIYFFWQQKQDTSPFYVQLDHAAALKEMKELQRLETATFTLEKIVEAGKTTITGSSIEEFFVGDKILLIAHGQVIAGFDMQNITENDIQINGQDITIQLPPPEILVSKLNNEKTTVYDRDRGIFTKGDKDLESEARKNAEKAIRQAACESGILTQAGENGKKQLSPLLKALNFVNVTIKVPSGTCE